MNDLHTHTHTCPNVSCRFLLFVCVLRWWPLFCLSGRVCRVCVPKRVIYIHMSDQRIYSGRDNHRARCLGIKLFGGSKRARERHAD